MTGVIINRKPNQKEDSPRIERLFLILPIPQEKKIDFHEPWKLPWLLLE